MRLRRHRAEMSRRTVAAALGSCVALSAGVASPDASARRAAATPVSGPTLSWAGCTDLPGAPAAAECAALRLPVSAASGPTVDLAVVRLRSTGPGRPLGSLVVNPGGPGVAARPFALRFAASGEGRVLRARYDIVAVDQRGTGASRPIACTTRQELDAYLLADATPDDANEREATVRTSSALGRACARREDAAWLRSLGTVTAVSDLDALRLALAEPTLTFYGFSYGTFLGLAYASAYPQSTGRMVLDGVLDPSLSILERAEGQAIGLDAAMERFLDWCDATCSWVHAGSDGRAPSSIGARAAGSGASESLRAWLDELDARPMRLGGRRIGETEVLTALLGAMYRGEREWPALASDLAEARRGDARGVARRFDAVVGRVVDGTYGRITEASFAVNCLDSAVPADVASVEALARSLPARAPWFGALVAWSALPCVGWPGSSTRPREPGQPAPTSGLGARSEIPGFVAGVVPGTSEVVPGTSGMLPLLLVTTTGDPVTPKSWAEAVAKRLGPPHRLVIVSGDTHTASLKGNACVSRLVKRYLIEAALPSARTTRCA